MDATTEHSSIDTAVKRLALALDALDAAVERRRESDRDEDALAQQLQTLGADRSKLAAALDGETARSRRLEAANRDVAGRLDLMFDKVDSQAEGPGFKG